MSGHEASVACGGRGAGPGLDQLMHPTHVAEMPDGGLLVTDRGNQRVLLFPPGEQCGLVVAGGKAGSALDSLDQPRGACYASGALFVCDAKNRRVLRFRATCPQSSLWASTWAVDKGSPTSHWPVQLCRATFQDK